MKQEEVQEGEGKVRGHIRKRSKNSWTVVVELPHDPETGKLKHKRVTVRGTKKDAERVLAKMVTDIERGALGSATRFFK